VGGATYAAMKEVPRDSAGEGAKRPSMISRLDERMWLGRRSTERIRKDTPRRYASKSGQGLWNT
jgi:hypothetical protein